MGVPSQKSDLRHPTSRRACTYSCVLFLLVVATGCEGVQNIGNTLNAVCGNSAVEIGETCDGIDFGQSDKSCESFGFSAGELACNSTCDGFDTSLCTSTECGNDLQEGIEVCDGTDLLNQGCDDLGFNGGMLACSPDCLSYDTSGCTSPNLSCGDDVQDIGETCDGTDLAGQSCETLGFNGGVLGCQDDCSGFDLSSCTADSAFCGNGVVENEEQCDGANMNGATCVNMGFDSGILNCYLNCQYDTTDCIDEPTCGCPESILGDGYCDTACNNALCNYDNGDCVSSGECSPGCTAAMLANSSCDEACNNAACDFDNELCVGVPTCPSECDSWLSDGYCDASCNLAECTWDGGDCCASSCTDATFECGGTSGQSFSCEDPAACENTGGCESCVGMCGTIAPSNGMGCSCDSSCSVLGDCCDDYVAACPDDGGGTGDGCSGDVSYLSDGWCDASTNNQGCGWDGGDCCESTCFDSTYECGAWASFNCQDTNACENTGGCNCDGDSSYLGDGWCDASTNNSGCQWDGGDCCESTCSDGTYSCGIVGYTCSNPTACENTGLGCP